MNAELRNADRAPMILMSRKPAEIGKRYTDVGINFGGVLENGEILGGDWFDQPFVVLRQATFEEYAATHEDFDPNDPTNPDPTKVFFYEVSVD